MKKARKLVLHRETLHSLERRDIIVEWGNSIFLCTSAECEETYKCW
jgi:hypothetical protein